MRPRWRHAVLVTIRRSWGRAGAQAAREGHVIELDEDLVIEERDDDRRYNFDRAVGLAIDETDRLYIHDSKRFRVVVYNADGRFSRAYGGAGDMAPFHLGWIAVAGERLAISTGACRTGEGGASAGETRCASTGTATSTSFRTSTAGGTATRFRWTSTRLLESVSSPGSSPIGAGCTPRAMPCTASRPARRRGISASSGTRYGLPLRSIGQIHGVRLASTSHGREQ